MMLKNVINVGDYIYNFMKGCLLFFYCLWTLTLPVGKDETYTKIGHYHDCLN